MFNSGDTLLQPTGSGTFAYSAHPQAVLRIPPPFFSNGRKWGGGSFQYRSQVPAAIPETATKQKDGAVRLARRRGLRIMCVTMVLEDFRARLYRERHVSVRRARKRALDVGI